MSRLPPANDDDRPAQDAREHFSPPWLPSQRMLILWSAILGCVAIWIVITVVIRHLIG